MLLPFAYFAPTTLAEALALRQAHGREARFLAGGTALLAALERRQTRAGAVIDLTRIAELREITTTPQGEIEIGALVSLHGIVASDLLGYQAPVLAQAVREMATPQVRNLATVGGNVASGLATADLVIALMALDADLRLATAGGENRVSVDDYVRQSYGVDAGVEGIITAIVLPHRPGHANYQKLTVRQAADLPLANVAVWAAIQSGRIVEAHIVAGACQGRPSRLPEVETLLQGEPFVDEVIEQASATAAAVVRQTGDRRAPGAYRRQMVGVLTRRALKEIRSMDGSHS